MANSSRYVRVHTTLEVKTYLDTSVIQDSDPGLGTWGILPIQCPFPKLKQDYAPFQHEVARAIVTPFPESPGEG